MRGERTERVSAITVVSINLVHMPCYSFHQFPLALLCRRCLLPGLSALASSSFPFPLLLGCAEFFLGSLSCTSPACLVLLLMPGGHKPCSPLHFHPRVPRHYLLLLRGRSPYL
ncbi:unnamed protein product [Pylaiella littoralis]